MIIMEGVKPNAKGQIDFAALGIKKEDRMGAYRNADGTFIVYANAITTDGSV